MSYKYVYIHVHMYARIYPCKHDTYICVNTYKQILDRLAMYTFTGIHFKDLGDEGQSKRLLKLRPLSSIYAEVRKHTTTQNHFQVGNL